MTRHSRSGSTMLGMTALTVLLAAFCTCVLLRSADAYHASALGHRRLQAQAAAEGAAVAWGRGVRGQMQIGACRITPDLERLTSTTTVLPMRVDVGVGSRVPFSGRYEAYFETSGTAGVRFIAVEKLP